MCDDERSTGFHSASYFLQRAQPFLHAQKVESEETGRRVERPIRRTRDIAFVQRHLRGERAERLLRELQHGGSGINSIEPPSRLSFGEDLEFHPPAGPEDEYPRILRRALGQQQ
jgi:hypothetical protein